MGLVPEERIELSSNEHESFVLTFVLFWYKWCGMTDLNRRPLECKSKALPAELIPHSYGGKPLTSPKSPWRTLVPKPNVETGIVFS